MKRIQALLGRLSSRVRQGTQWRLGVLYVLVLWLFMPPPQDGHAACAPWEGGPCIDVHPTPGGSGDRPPRDDTEPSPRSSGPGCASMPTRPSGDAGSSEPTPVAGTPHPTLPHVVWTENGKFRAADGYRWVKPDDPNNFDVEPYPDGSPHPTWPHVVWAGEGNSYHPAPGYTWRYPNDANDSQVVRIVNVANWASNWRGEDRDVAVDVLRGMKDVKLMDWMAANVQFGRFPDDNVSPLSASGAMLRFKDVFFGQRTPPAQRENLLAFEGGKVFYEMMKDVPIDGGQTFERWFIGYYPSHNSVISDMSKARHSGQPLGTSDLIDAHSAFGHLFRAQALELDKPIGYWKQKDWDAVQQTFKQHLDRVMRGR